MGEFTTDPTTSTEAGGRDKGLPSDNRPAAKVDLQFQLLFAALYHDLCETYLMRVHRALTAANLMLGSGAAVAIGAQYPGVAQAMGLTIALIGTVQLVWDYGRTARDHAFLRQRFYELLADCRKGRDAIEIEACMTVLFGSEPPIVERMRKRAHDRAGRSLYGENFNRA